MNASGSWWIDRSVIALTVGFGRPYKNKSDDGEHHDSSALLDCFLSQLNGLECLGDACLLLLHAQKELQLKKPRLSLVTTDNT
jgi:hypothetical protein